MQKELEQPSEKPKPSWELSESEEEEEEENEQDPTSEAIAEKEDMEPITKEEEIQNIRVVVEPQRNSSPFSVFTKLSQFQSKFDPKSKISPMLKSSPASGGKFKPVMSRNNSMKEICSNSQESTIDVVLDTASQKTTGVGNSQRSIASDLSTQSTDFDTSQKSIALCSIDTDCLSMSSQPSLPRLPDSDSFTENSPKQQKTLTSFFYRKPSSGIEPRSTSAQSTPKSTSPLSAGSASTGKKGKSFIWNDIVFINDTIPLFFDLQKFKYFYIFYRTTHFLFNILLTILIRL